MLNIWQLDYNLKINKELKANNLNLYFNSTWLKGYWFNLHWTFPLLQNKLNLYLTFRLQRNCIKLRGGFTVNLLAIVHSTKLRPFFRSNKSQNLFNLSNAHVSSPWLIVSSGNFWPNGTLFAFKIFAFENTATESVGIILWANLFHNNRVEC